MKTKFAVLALVLFSFIAMAQQRVDQGAPGTQGPWPVTLSGGGINLNVDGGLTIALDGGRVFTAYRSGLYPSTPNPALVYLPAPYEGDINNPARPLHHVTVGGVCAAVVDGGTGPSGTEPMYSALPIARNNVENDIVQVQGRVSGVRVAGAQGNIDRILPVVINDPTNATFIATEYTGLMEAGRFLNYTGAYYAKVMRVGTTGAPVGDFHCYGATNTVVSVGAFGSPTLTPGSNLNNRRFAMVCNDPRNSASNYLICSESSTPNASTDPGDVLNPGDCATYWVQDVASIYCVSNVAATVARVKQCI